MPGIASKKIGFENDDRPIAWVIVLWSPSLIITSFM